MPWKYWLIFFLYPVGLFNISVFNMLFHRLMLQENVGCFTCTKLLSVTLNYSWLFVIWVLSTEPKPSKYLANILSLSKIHSILYYIPKANSQSYPNLWKSVFFFYFRNPCIKNVLYESFSFISSVLTSSLPMFPTHSILNSLLL